VTVRNPITDTRGETVNRRERREAEREERKRAFLSTQEKARRATWGHVDSAVGHNLTNDVLRTLEGYQDRPGYEYVLKRVADWARDLDEEGAELVGPRRTSTSYEKALWDALSYVNLPVAIAREMQRVEPGKWSTQDALTLVQMFYVGSDAKCSVACLAKRYLSEWANA
jgi:hypothetical protein